MPIAIIGGLEKAFPQVALNRPDRDATRFLWLSDITSPPSHSNLKVFRFAGVPFGLNASPFFLAATIKTHLDWYDDVTLAEEI